MEEEGEVTDDNIKFNQERIDRKAAYEIVRMSIVQILEGRK